MTIFALEQAVSNGCQPCITEVESALGEVAALRADLDRAIVNFGDAAATVCDMRAQIAEAPRDEERLDWIEKIALRELPSPPRRGMWKLGDELMVGVSLRAAIDAAKGESNG